MPRLVPLAGGLLLALAIGVAVLAGFGTGAACAQSGVAPRLDCGTGTAPVPGSAPAPIAGGPAGGCSVANLLRDVRVRRDGQGLRITYGRRAAGRVRVDVFQSAVRARVVGERLVFRRSSTRATTVRWSGKRQRRRARASSAGVFYARVAITAAAGRRDVRRVALIRRDGRFRTRPTFQRRASCRGALRNVKLERPAFGGSANRALDVSFRLAGDGRVTVDLLRGATQVRRLSRADREGGTLHRVRLSSEGLRRAVYRVRVRATVGGRTTTSTLTTQRV